MQIIKNGNKQEQVMVTWTHKSPERGPAIINFYKDATKQFLES